MIKFNPSDYAYFTSFTHHPFYQPFVIEVPDNFSNGAYYNIPINELVGITKTAVQNGYTVMWDTDVSNSGWMPATGYALAPANDAPAAPGMDPDQQEKPNSQEYRQRLYEELVTQDDHLMHITGLGKSKKGKDFFIVKNSWGTRSGPFEGYVNVSESYFAINTITVVVPKAALDKSVKDKLAKN